jgi:hypothetical protein
VFVPRSRKSFRWMDAPVLWHNVALALPAASTSDPARQSYGRGLYGRKLSPVGAARPAGAGTDSDSSTPHGAISRPPRRLLRWQVPLSYLVIWQGRGWMVTWHAPWCRRCDCAGAGWRFLREGGYMAGLGFELSSPRYADDAVDA